MQRLLFCANSGRVGSEYLATLLDSTVEAVVGHEPEPQMIGRFVRMANRKPYRVTRARRQVKVAALQRALDDLPDGKTVLGETSHMFVKTFHDVVLDAFPTSTVIVLRRPLAQTVRSFHQLGYFTQHNKNWPKWMTSPNATTAALPAIDRDRRLDDIDLAIAYLLDIEARTQRLMAEHPDIETLEIRLRDVTDSERVPKVLDALALTPTEATRQVVGTRVNGKARRKTEANRHVELAECERRISRYLELATARFAGTPHAEVLAAAADKVLSPPSLQAVP